MSKKFNKKSTSEEIATKASEILNDDRFSEKAKSVAGSALSQTKRSGQKTTSDYDFSNLKAVFLNCTLKKGGSISNTQGLMDVSINIMKKHGVQVSNYRITDFDIPAGVYPDMTEHGFEKDDWVEIQKEIMQADILVLGTPIWLGDKSSVCTKVVERLYGYSHLLNDQGQYAYYGKVGGCLITGNEDGVKHCAMNILYSLGHIGYTIAPQADAGWIGESGPGPSYLDKNSGGPENDFTNRNVTFMTWNLMHMANNLQKNGIPAHGNQFSEWETGERFDFSKAEYQNPEYRR